MLAWVEASSSMPCDAPSAHPARSPRAPFSSTPSTKKAAGFYARYGFKPASTEPLTLMVPLAAVRRTLSL